MGILKEHAICGHPMLAGRCSVCRCRELSKMYRKQAKTVQVIVDAVKGTDPEANEIRDALASARHALRDDARVWEDIADAILARYGVQSKHAAD